ncbi:MAG: hypothetical protein IPK83_01910 [Planctomycetes bacterium]|nr:hypothetical protein [Planctomycetota bacterium]
MSMLRLYRRGSIFVFSLVAIGTLGCEGIDRHHDSRVGDIAPPPEDVDFRTASTTETANFPDLIEEMIQKRDVYIAHLIQIERAYLDVGDINRANWARRQRELTEKVEIYPYLTERATVQQNVQAQVIPRDSIPEADKLFDQAYAMYDKFVGVPFVGFAYLNKQEPRDAADLFKRVINEHPTSDKVDDAAYFIGNIYKEFLRNDDPDNELALRYLRWAWSLDPRTPHPARFDAAVIYDFRLHDRDKAIELYHDVLALEEAGNNSNQRFSATRIAQLTDDDDSHLKPQEPRVANQKPQPQRTDTTATNEPTPDTSREPGPVSSRMPDGDGE